VTALQLFFHASGVGHFIPMHFPARLIQLRRAASHTQQSFSEAASLHVNQIRRYEAGTAQPTLDALIRLAKALGVSLDTLVFEEGERGPEDALRYQFESVARLPAHDQSVVRELLDAVIVKHQVAGALARVQLPEAVAVPAVDAAPAAKTAKASHASPHTSPRKTSRSTTRSKALA
jgi:transcriptional regulator with XRE-family HTH domain